MNFYTTYSACPENSDAVDSVFFEIVKTPVGDKRKQIPENGEMTGIDFITKLYREFQDSEFVKIYPNEQGLRI